MTNASPTPGAWKKVTLQEPIEIPDKPIISELTLEKPCAKHLRCLPADDFSFGDLIDAAASMADLTEAQVDEIGMFDYQVLIEAVSEAMEPLSSITDFSSTEDKTAPAAPFLLELEDPISRGTEQVCHLTFHRPKAKHVRDIPLSGGTMGHILDAAGKMTAESPGLMDKLSPRDFAKVIETTTLFLVGSRQTGAQSSGT